MPKKILSKSDKEQIKTKFRNLDNGRLRKHAIYCDLAKEFGINQNYCRNIVLGIV